MNFKNELKEKAKNFENYLKNIMINNALYQKILFDAMIYSLDAGGKRLRPILLMEAFRLFSEDIKKSIPFACAIEMIHTYSLIHDDLPCMDNDDLRRGKPTNHKVFGEGIAVLAGDGLLNYAFEIMCESSIKDEKNAFVYLKGISEIAKGAGVYGMIAGQVVDIESENKSIDKETLDFIHMNKTAAMIIGAMRCGAILGECSEEDLLNITKYAKNIGLAFQIVDDILDVIGDESKLGKKVGSDEDNNKATYPSLFGIAKSKEIANDLIEEAKMSIDHIKNNEFLIELANYIVQRDY